MIIPKKYDGTERGYEGCEEECHKLLANILPKDYVAVFQKQTQTGNQSDIILLVPEHGVLIIEMKAWQVNNIEKVDLGGAPVLKHVSTTDTHNTNPLNQAKYYRDIYLSQTKTTAVFGYSVWLSNMTNREMQQKGFDVNSGNGVLFFTKEDFVSTEAFTNKIEKIFDVFNDNFMMPSEFLTDELVEFGNMLMKGFEEEYRAYIKANENDYTVSKDYSELVISVKADDELIEHLFMQWKGGTKILFFSSRPKDVEALKEKIKTYIASRGLNTLYDVKKDMIFNCVLGCSPSITQDISIKNGESYELYDKELSDINSHIEIPFNYEQYKVEYSAAENLIVNAGAGSGKTFLLVSRMDYLCWKNDYSAEDIQEKIVLITFTNDATNEMKERLEGHFVKKYLLTNAEKYFKYINVIENMMISTIDSISLKIIKKYAFYLGLGKDVSITTASIYRDEEIRNAITRVLEANHVNENQIPSYLLDRILEKALEKYSNRNIDLANEKDVLPEPPSSFLDYVLNELPTIERRIEERCAEDNKIPQGLILVYLRRILALMDSGRIPNLLDVNVKYLFIDEFQDTDDVQINVVAYFKKKLNLNLCVVGDVKQSIYRFRGSNEDRAFEYLKLLLGGTANCEERPLKKNYRTNAKMLDTLNVSFEKMQNARLFNNQRLTGVINPTASEDITEYSVTSDEEREAEIVNIIKSFCAKDTNDTMCILVRSNNDILAIRDICRRNDIFEVNTEIGGKLYNQESTIDLYKLVLALQNPYSVNAYYNLYTTSYISETLDKTRIVKYGPKVDVEAVPQTLKNWGRYIESLKTEPVLKVLMNIIDEVKPWEIYAMKQGFNDEAFDDCAREYRYNLEKLLEKITNDKNGAYLSINSLVNWLKIMTTTGQEEEERQAGTRYKIDCLTVHKSKGKEYDTVFLPYTDVKVKIEHFFSSEPAENNRHFSCNFLLGTDNKLGYTVMLSDGTIIRNNRYMSQLTDDDMSQSCEEARILYVALTRLKKSLVYINNVEKEYRPNKPVSWRDMIFNH